MTSRTHALLLGALLLVLRAFAVIALLDVVLLASHIVGQIEAGHGVDYLLAGSTVVIGAFALYLLARPAKVVAALREDARRTSRSRERAEATAPARERVSA